MPPTIFPFLSLPPFLRWQMLLRHYIVPTHVGALRETRSYPEMEIGAAIALSSGCLTVARFATSLAAGMNDLRQRYRAVGGDIDGLAAQISATESALSELSSVLANNPSSGLRRSPNVSPSIQSCIAVCSATIVDVKEHIDQVRSESGAITFAGRVTHLWSRDVVQQALDADTGHAIPAHRFCNASHHCRVHGVFCTCTALTYVLCSDSADAVKARLQAKDAVSILSGAESDAQAYLQT